MDLSELQRLTPPTTPAEVLRRARALISDPGCWWQSGSPDSTGTNCAATAIYRCTKDDKLADRALSYLSAAINTQDHISFIFYWNDHRSRTHGQVMAAFARAIELAK